MERKFWPVRVSETRTRTVWIEAETGEDAEKYANKWEQGSPVPPMDAPDAPYSERRDDWSVHGSYIDDAWEEVQAFNHEYHLGHLVMVWHENFHPGKLYELRSKAYPVDGDNTPDGVGVAMIDIDGMPVPLRCVEA